MSRGDAGPGPSAPPEGDPRPPDRPRGPRRIGWPQIAVWAVGVAPLSVLAGAVLGPSVTAPAFAALTVVWYWLARNRPELLDPRRYV